jgi:hypothetical protein
MCINQGLRLNNSKMIRPNLSYISHELWNYYAYVAIDLLSKHWFQRKYMMESDAGNNTIKMNSILLIRNIIKILFEPDRIQ